MTHNNIQNRAFHKSWILLKKDEQQHNWDIYYDTLRSGNDKKNILLWPFPAHNWCWIFYEYFEFDSVQPGKMCNIHKTIAGITDNNRFTFIIVQRMEHMC